MFSKHNFLPNFYDRFCHDPEDWWRTVKTTGYGDQNALMLWVHENCQGKYSNLYLGHSDSTLWYFESRIAAIKFALTWA